MMILLDIEKAFDKIWKDGLTYKLLNLQAPIRLTKLLHNYMQQRTFQVNYKNTLSTKRNAMSGVIQGSILGPTLFTTYISDMPPTKYLKKTLFADDTALYRTGKLTKKEIRLIHKDLNSLTDYYKKWKIKINVSKTEGIIFHHGNDSKITKPTFDNTDIEWKTHVKYLGTILDKRLTWLQNTKYMTNKANIGLNKIYRLINMKSKLKTNLKVLLYKTIIRPTMTYAAPTWAQAAKTHHNKLQKIQNKTLRTIYRGQYKHKTDKLHQEAKLEKLKDFTNRLTRNFADKTKTIDNPHIQTLGQYNPIKLGRKKSQFKKLVILPGKNPFVLRK